MGKRKSVAPSVLMDRELDDVRGRTINEPTVLYKVGDRVSHGNIEKSIVTETLDGGKILKLHEHCRDTNYGRPISSERDIYVAWHEVVPYIAHSFQPSHLSFDDSYSFQFMQQDVHSLFTVYYHFGLDMSADYQRGNVWTEADKVALIDSIFKNVEIGKFVFLHLPFKANSPGYECLDGKQRMMALVEFYEGRFKYKGFRYQDLCWRDQHYFKHYAVSVAQTKRELTQKQKYDYFIRLNTRGKPMDQAHIDCVKKLYSKA